MRRADVAPSPAWRQIGEVGSVRATCIGSTLVLLAGCVDPLTSNARSTPAWTVENVKAFGETATGDPPDRAIAWDLRVAGGLARWRECTAVNACTETERERPADELLAVERVGRTSINDRGDEVDVVRLSLAPRRRYVIPVKTP